MAYEIQLDIGTPGLSGIYCRSWQGSTGGATIALSEISGAGGVYGNDGALSLAAGEYVLRGYDIADSLIARSGLVVWNGSEFVGATAAQVWEYSGGDRALSGPQATAITSAATLAQVQSAGFTTDRHNALIAADLAARALADGRYIIDYGDSTATQYDASGSVRTVFNLLESDGTTPATTAATSLERVPE